MLALAMAQPYRQLNVRIPVASHRLLDTIKERDGVPIAEQVKRAILLYADSKGLVVPKRGGKHAAA